MCHRLTDRLWYHSEAVRLFILLATKISYVPIRAFFFVNDVLPRFAFYLINNDSVLLEPRALTSNLSNMHSDDTFAPFLVFCLPFFASLIHTVKVNRPSLLLGSQSTVNHRKQINRSCSPRRADEDVYLGQVNRWITTGMKSVPPPEITREITMNTRPWPVKTFHSGSTYKAETGTNAIGCGEIDKPTENIVV